MDWKKQARENAKSYDGTKMKPMNSSVYSKWIHEYLSYLNCSSMDFCISTIFGILGNYITAVENKKDAYPEAYRNIVKFYRPIMGDFSWAWGTVIKQKKYKRTSAFESQIVKIDLIKEITNIALQLSYDDAINFIGELVGAWVLTYPVAAINKYEIELLPQNWANEEDDYIYILERRLAYEYEEWMK